MPDTPFVTPEEAANALAVLDKVAAAVDEARRAVASARDGIVPNYPDASDFTDEPDDVRIYVGLAVEGPVRYFGDELRDVAFEIHGMSD
jgi:hypothetical protein